MKTLKDNNETLTQHIENNFDYVNERYEIYGTMRDVINRFQIEVKLNDDDNTVLNWTGKNDKTVANFSWQVETLMNKKRIDIADVTSITVKGLTMHATTKPIIKAFR